MGNIKNKNEGRKRNPIKTLGKISGGFIMNTKNISKLILIILLAGALPIFLMPNDAFTGPLDNWGIDYNIMTPSTGSFQGGVAYGLCQALCVKRREGTSWPLEL